MAIQYSSDGVLIEFGGVGDIEFKTPYYPNFIPLHCKLYDAYPYKKPERLRWSITDSILLYCRYRSCNVEVTKKCIQKSKQWWQRGSVDLFPF